ncbi:MAG: efflux RND transporter periplasmic adaptor subunit, partial [Bacteroidota bacterium]
MNISRPIILTGISALLIGFVLAWMVKPEETQPHYHGGSHEKEGEIWTCSMHPQIRLDEPGLCPICEMDLVAASKNSEDDPLLLKMSESAMRLAQIESQIIGTGKVGSKNLRLSGKIQADERLAASQVAHVPGRIEKLYVTFTGEQIRKGQKLADIYSPELFTAQEELLQALKFAKENPELLEAARKKLEYWKISAEQIAEIEKSQEIMGTFTLHADASGIVKERKVSLGDHVDPGDLLFELQNLDRLWLLFDAYEEDLAQIKLGDRIRFRTTALAGQEFESKVAFIDPVINPETRAASIRGEIINRGRKLKPEMFIEGQLESPAASKEELLIPKSAVLWTGKRSVVYIKVPKSEAPAFQYREIELGERMGDQYLVKSGLEAGEEIVVQGSFSIDAAAQLNNQSSMMNAWLAKSEKEKEVEEEEAAKPSFNEGLPLSFSKALKSLMTSYLQLKDALVATDPDKSKVGAEKFQENLQAIDTESLSDSAQIFWNKQEKALEAHGKLLSETSSVEGQRKQF